MAHSAPGRIGRRAEPLHRDLVWWRDEMEPVVASVKPSPAHGAGGDGDQGCPRAGAQVVASSWVWRLGNERRLGPSSARALVAAVERPAVAPD